jgi:hypothetical protein
MDLLYNAPAALLLFLVLGVSIAAALGAQIFIHRRFNGGDFVEHNEVGGVIIVVVASLYAVLLGFMTVVAWEHFQESREIVVVESDAAIDAWHTAVGLSPSIRTRVRQDMIKYAHVMVDKEWSLMKKGQSDPSAVMLSMDAIEATGGFLPKDFAQSNAQNATLQQLGVLHDARQRRIGMNEGGISWFEWLILVCGALCIICFCWLFGGSRPAVHLIMTATVVIMIASTLVLLFELQYPFRSSIGVGPSAWIEALKHISEMEGGKMADMRM